MNVPNALSLFRLANVPVLVGLAWYEYPTAFLVAFTASLVSDMVDGFVARRFGQATPLGAKLDSWGDLATWSVLPVCAWWSWSPVIVREMTFVVVAGVAFVLPTLLGLLKFQRVTSYHTWGAKASALLMGPSLLVLFAFDQPWPFRLASLFFALAEIEEIAITAVLPRPYTDVHTIFQALRLADPSARQPPGTDEPRHSVSSSPPS